jgi:[protein-PII] uridylyltransferase
VKHMPLPTQIFIHPASGHHDQQQQLQQLDVVANDRPGLLASMALVLLNHDVALHNAKVNTLGNRVEDSFLISTSDGQPLDETQINALKSAFSEL